MRAAVLLIAATTAVLAGSATGGDVHGGKGGGTFVVAEPGAYIDSIDASLSAIASSEQLFAATCSGLMRLPDAPAPAGLRPQPELAAGFPRISSDGKTYVFTIRKGLRFSTGAPVTARDVAYTINRILNPALKSPDVIFYRQILGAQDVLSGKAASAKGISARGSALTIKLTHRVGDFVAGVASSLCVLPAGLPIDREGVKAPVPTAAPYSISEFVPGERIVLERNPFYRGSRPHRVDGFVFDLTPDDNGALDAVLTGTADYAWVPNFAYAARAPEFVRRFGVNKRRFFVNPAAFLRMFVLNASRPLFRGNVQLRRAVNFAIDRPALLRQLGGPYFGRPTDQFLAPILPGYTNAQVYPLRGPDVGKARALAKGHTRSGKLVLYVSSRPEPLQQAQIVKHDFKRIGLDVRIEAFSSPLLFQKLATRGEPFDMGWVGWLTVPPDPGLLSNLFDGSTIGTAPNVNWSYFDSPKYNRLLRRASRLTGESRYRAYGNLDVELTRDAAPGIAYSVDNALTLVSARTGCVIVNPYLDLAAVCLK